MASNVTNKLGSPHYRHMLSSQTRFNRSKSWWSTAITPPIDLTARIRTLRAMIDPIAWHAMEQGKKFQGQN